MLYIDLKKKTLICIEMTPNIVQFCDDPSIYPKDLHTQKIIFLKTTKIMKFKISDAKK